MTQNSLLNVNNNELEIIEFLIEEKQPDGSAYSGHYGINVAKVLEIIRLPSVTSVPSKHDSSVLGTFNLRGKVLPILNLAAWLGKEMASDENNKVIVTEFSGVQAAFLVSSVTSIHRMTWDRIEPPNRYVQAYSRESITGVLRIQDRVLFILDMEKILASLDSTLDMSQVEVDTTPVEGAGQFHLLVADDSSSLRHILKSSLEKSGFQVTVVGSGREAWRLSFGTAQRCPVQTGGTHRTGASGHFRHRNAGNGRPRAHGQNPRDAGHAATAGDPLLLPDHRSPARQGRQSGRGPAGFQARSARPEQNHPRADRRKAA